MTDSKTIPTTESRIEPLRAEDLDAVVSIDAGLGGGSRRGFFEKRLAAALEYPGEFVYVGLREADRLVGFAHARLLEGEFGKFGPRAALDAIGVAPDRRGTGVGRHLITGVEKVLRHKHIGELTSQVDWRNQNLLGFFARAGFAVAPRTVLTRATDRPIREPSADLDPDERASPGPGGETAELDFSSPVSDDFEALSRDGIPVRSMNAGDLDGLVTIDRKATGLDRTAYYRRKLREAMHESGIRISLVAERDGQLAGFIMARVDFGEFGHTGPEAVMDTIGVDPGYRRGGMGRALMSQLIANLSILRVEHVRTEISWNDVGLIRYLDDLGFAPAQRVALVRLLN